MRIANGYLVILFLHGLARELAFDSPEENVVLVLLDDVAWRPEGAIRVFEIWRLIPEISHSHGSGLKIIATG